MHKLFEKILKAVYLFAAFLLIFIAVLTMGWSAWEIVLHFNFDKETTTRILQSVGAIVISVAILDVAKYMYEEEVCRSKELRSPEEARKTLTKIFVIISIAVSLEGLVYIFKAGAKDVSLLPYPAILVLVAVFAMVGLGVYQKLSVKTEKETGEIERNEK
ncbi:MAG: hypothetical protein MRJ65_10575 [Candidatus Brocadiaceae bacterium]|nr:hypothetical protein [Candidatus Brocadiaceae bacterium]